MEKKVSSQSYDAKNLMHNAVSTSSSKVKLDIDRDDEVKVDFSVTKSDIELSGMDHYDCDLKGDVDTLNDVQEIEMADRFKAEGNVLMRQGDIKGAVEAYTKAIDFTRGNYIVFNNRAAAHIINQDFEDAIDDCNSSLSLKNNLKAHCRKGQALGGLKKYQEALESVDRALEMQAHDAEATSVKANLMRDQAEHEDLAKLEKFKNEGNQLLQKEDYSGAISAFNKALALSKNKSYVIYNNLAVALLLSGDYESAVDVCDKSLAIKKSSKAFCRKAQALRKLNMIEDAVVMVNAALTLNSDDKEACRIKEELRDDEAMLETDAMVFYNIQERSAGDIVSECMSTGDADGDEKSW